MGKDSGFGLNPPKVPLTIRVGVTGHRTLEDCATLRSSIDAALSEIARIARVVAHESPHLPTPPVLRVVSPLAEGADRFVAKQARKMDYEMFCPLPFTPIVYKASFKGGIASEIEFDELLLQADSVLVIEGREDKGLASSFGQRVRSIMDLRSEKSRIRQKSSEIKFRPWWGSILNGWLRSISVLKPFFRGQFSEHRKAPPPSLGDLAGPIPLAVDSKRHLEGLDERDYLPVGLAVIRHSDVLIAIWNGESEQGVGGTGEIVRKAQRAGLPVIWIHSKNPSKIELLGEGDERRESLSKLENVLRKTFSVPEELVGDRVAADDFFQESCEGWTFGGFHKAFLLPFAAKWPVFNFDSRQYFMNAKEEWERGWVGWSRPNAKRFVSGGYGEHFEWADGLAECYAGKYRSAVIISYLMGACAVLLAFLGLHESIEGEWKVVCSVVEFAILVAVLGLIKYGRNRRWHERWLDYRVLAELLRTMQFLALLGRVSPSFRVPPHLAHRDPQHSWVLWHFRAIVRHVGSISTLLDHKHLEACRTLTSRRARSQSVYHENKAKEAGLIARNLHRLGLFLFGLAILGCSIHALEKVCSLHFERFKIATDIFVVVLPAFGAAIASVMHVLEFERIQHRSEALGTRLKDTAKEFLTLSRDRLPSELGGLADNAAKIFLSELVDWRFVFLGKDLEPPA